MINIPNDATHYIFDSNVKTFYREHSDANSRLGLDKWSFKQQRWNPCGPSQLVMDTPFLIPINRCRSCPAGKNSMTSRKRVGPVSRSKHWSILVDECSYCGTVTPAYTTGVSPKLVRWTMRYSKHVRPLVDRARTEQYVSSVLVTTVPIGASPTDGTTEYSLRFTR